jgi:hemolysin activation/secretion protein
MIKTPAPDSQLDRDLQTLSRLPQGQALVSYLRTTRTGIMELMTQVNDDVRLRQFQGAATALGDLISLLTRIP